MSDETIDEAESKLEEMEAVQEKIDWSDSALKKTSPKQARELVWAQLVLKKRDRATEWLARWILAHEHIFTTASDTHPETWFYEDGVYLPNGKSKIKEICREIFGQAYTPQLVNAVLFKIEGSSMIEPEKFYGTPVPELACVENGILNILTGELLPHTHERIFFNKHPVKYLPEQQADAWNNHLKAVLASKEDRELLQELFGFCLLKDYRFEKAFMLNGSGRNGKGKTLEVLKTLLGPQNCSATSLQDLDGYIFAAADLLNKNANICGDLPAKALTGSGIFKTLTGHDLRTNARKNKDPISATNYAKLIFSANEIPRTCDDTDAFFDRWYIVDFPYTFLPANERNNLPESKRAFIKERDPEIISKLTTPSELSGILNWSLVGLQRLLKNKCFTTNQTMVSVKATWLRRSDSFAAFCLDHIEDAVGVGWEIDKDELRKLYQDYCKTHKTKLHDDKHIALYLKTNLCAADKIKVNRVASANSRDGDMSERYSVWVNIRYQKEKSKQTELL